MNDKIRISGLWKNQSKNGITYLKGNLSPVASLLIMPNDYKKTDRDPDYFLYMTQNEKKAEKEAEKEPVTSDL